MDDPWPSELAHSGDVAAYMQFVGEAARRAARMVARSSTRTRNLALECIADAIRRDARRLLDANDEDVAAARASRHDAAFVDRLTLTPRSIEAMAQGLMEIVALPDPVGEISDLA